MPKHLELNNYTPIAPLLSLFNFFKSTQVYFRHVRARTRAMRPIITATLITAYTANGVAVVLRHVRCRTIYRWMRNTKTFHLKKTDLFDYESSHFN